MRPDLQAVIDAVNAADPKPDAWISSQFRRYLQRLGYQGVSICMLEDSKNRYICSGIDPLGDKPFCRTYTVTEMRMILHVSHIFWRYIK